MISSVAIEGYRSIRSLRLPLGALTVVLGENGAGKTNFYKALELIRASAQGTLARRLASEGGMHSALWARNILDPHQSNDENPAYRMRFAVEIEGIAYALTLGLPSPGDAALAMDPCIKEESISLPSREGRRVAMMRRKGSSFSARDEDSAWREYGTRLLASETALSMLRDPVQFPEMEVLQRHMADWRFHHLFDTSVESPLRIPQPMICAPMLDSTGDNLAAALATAVNLRSDARNSKDGDVTNSDIGRAIEEAFPGSRLEFLENGGRHMIGLSTKDFPRPFTAQELSDGILKYLCLIAALCPYRRCGFTVLNEPETSLHPDLIDPLAAMIMHASTQSQILIVTHSERLARILRVEAGATSLRLDKVGGETYASEDVV